MVKQRIDTPAWNGQRLASLRKAAGFTQAELAEAIGVSRRMIAYYETETGHPPAALLVSLAQTLKVSTDELLGVTTAPKAAPQPANRRLTRRLARIEHLGKRDQEALLRTIDAFLAKAS